MSFFKRFPYLPELVALQSVDPSVASIVYAGEPVWGVLFAVVFMGDRLNAWGWCGAALVMVSGLATQAWDHARERGQGASDKGWRTAAAGEGLLPRKRPRPNRRPSAKALRPAAKTSGGVCYSSSAVNESLTAEEELLV